MQITKITEIELKGGKPKPLVSSVFEMIQQKRKIEIRKKEYLVGVWFATFLTMFILGFLIFTEMPPKINFVKTLGIDSEGYTSLGNYIRMTNNINIGLDNHLDTYNTIFHEYSHYIYFRKLSRNEIKEWENICHKYTMPSYEYLFDGMTNKRCEEMFAINMAYYLEFINHDKMYLTIWENKTEWFDFIERMYIKYF